MLVITMFSVIVIDGVAFVGEDKAVRMVSCMIGMQKELDRAGGTTLLPLSQTSLVPNMSHLHCQVPDRSLLLASS